MLHNDNHNDLFDSGVTAFINKDYTSSIEIFTRAVEAGDPSYQVLVSRGAAYLQTHQVQNALQDFNRAIALQPDHARGYHMRALVYDQQGDHDAALEDLNRAIDLDPEYGAALKSRAMVLDKVGRGDEAAEDMRQATQLAELRLARFNNENNVWQSQHLKLEAEEVVSELER